MDRTRLRQAARHLIWAALVFNAAVVGGILWGPAFAVASAAGFWALILALLVWSGSPALGHRALDVSRHMLSAAPALAYGILVAPRYVPAPYSFRPCELRILVTAHEAVTPTPLAVLLMILWFGWQLAVAPGVYAMARRPTPSAPWSSLVSSAVVGLGGGVCALCVLDDISTAFGLSYVSLESLCDPSYLVALGLFSGLLIWPLCVLFLWVQGRPGLDGSEPSGC